MGHGAGLAAWERFFPGSSNLKGLIAGWTRSVSSLEDDGRQVVRVDQASARD
jgi:hypothetical protein